MRQAAEFLIGEHDFKSFCANRRMKKSTVRRIDEIRIVEHGTKLEFLYTGNGFLYNMVRILTGTLLEVGSGTRRPEKMKEIIAAKTVIWREEQLRPRDYSFSTWAMRAKGKRYDESEQRI